MNPYDRIAREAHSLSLCLDGNDADLARLIGQLADDLHDWGPLPADEDPRYVEMSRMLTETMDDVERIQAQLTALERDHDELSRAHEYLKAEVEAQGKGLDVLERERPA